MRNINRDFWARKRVFVTGHMGFKGAWLCALLSQMGANTVGFGQDDRSPLLYRELSIRGHTHNDGSINDFSKLSSVMLKARPQILFHLAAQPIVLDSLIDPVGTFEANLMGTVRVLEAARSLPELKAIVIVTTDKVYQNNEWVWAYRESDQLGGNDPYSASKAAAEMATNAMRTSFYSRPGAARIASVRAGNVIGGGDWAAHRLLPDAARSLGAGQPLICRNPESIRPWQHVLDPLVGYMLLAEQLYHADSSFDAWNFGPSQNEAMSVASVADIFVSAWGIDASWKAAGISTDEIKESMVLTIDSSLARNELGWEPRWSSREAVRRTAHWYRNHSKGESAEKLVYNDIRDYLSA